MPTFCRVLTGTLSVLTVLLRGYGRNHWGRGTEDVLRGRAHRLFSTTKGRSSPGIPEQFLQLKLRYWLQRRRGGHRSSLLPDDPRFCLPPGADEDSGFRGRLPLRSWDL